MPYTSQIQRNTDSEEITPAFDHLNKSGEGPHKFYVVSGLHQMHCFVETRYPTYSNYSKEVWDIHMEHCFGSLRLSISCGSPFAVEGSSPLADPRGHRLVASTVTGWGVEHDCVNYEAMWSFPINQEKL
ncbi:hypothetical protein PGQ11_006190 [Apiospora arundinis]|uniref:Peptidase S1 domain-containing protein n=1 Tax=Apiospora arundinis TaxID=335852 RepID=A0ABR2ISM1_9PEZI